jgi:hypothetical protein
MFPYEIAKKNLISLLEDNLPDNFKDFAELVVDLHISEESFAMNKSTIEDDLKIQEMILNGYSKEDILKLVKFEDTKTREGMFRVLVRTHLNRSGINHLTMGMSSKNKKTLSPRILNFTDSIDIIEDNEKTILEKWLDFGIQNSQHLISNDLKYDDRAVKALTSLENYFSKQENQNIFNNYNIKLKSAVCLSKELNIDLGWCRIVLGVLTGLNYLKTNNWEELYKKSFDDDISYFQIDGLIKDCQKNVCEYGYALAGSFFGDLGSPYFVKDDTHVRDGMNSIFTGLSTPEERVKAIIQSAQNIGVKPRVIDKILYLAGSGNFYLIGLNIKSPRAIKTKFLDKISQFSSNKN